jgi:hypothetical protein
MTKYIVTREPKKLFNYLDEYLGMSKKSAIFYSPEIGKHRYYRNNLENPDKGLELLTFEGEYLAQVVCNTTIEIYGDDWKVEELIETKPTSA